MSKQEEMFNLVEEFQSSGFSAKKFSHEKGLSPSTFSYWVRKKRQEDHPDGFLKIDPLVQSSEKSLELIYPNGVRLQMNSTDLPLIEKLLKLY